MRFAAATDSGALAAIRSASSCVRSCSSAVGTTRLTSPISYARAALTGSPVSRISAAARGPTIHGSGAAHGAPRPTRTSVTANAACSAATTRSHCCARRNPPA